MNIAARRLLSVTFVLALIVGGSVLGGASASAEVTHGFKFSFNGSEAPEGPFQGDLGAMAMGQATGDVYVVEYSRAVVERFDAAGKYLGEITGAAVPRGSLGLFYYYSGVAVDNSGGSNNGDLYVAGTENNVVYRFDSSGKLLSELNGSGTPAGSFTPTGVAVDPAGDLYVADRANDVVDEFDASGAYIGQIASPEIVEPATISVDSTGDVYLTNFVQSVVKLEPGGGASVLDANKAEAVAVDSATDHVYVSENNAPSPGRIVEFDQSGNRLGAFGEEQVSNNVFGIAVHGATGEVYAADNNNKLVYVFGAGVVIPDATSEAASNVAPQSVTLNGTVNPDGLPVSSCRFEYGTSGSYGQSVPCEQSPGSIGSGTSPVAVSADLSGLQPDTEYHIRISASNANGTNQGADVTVTTTGAARIDSETATNVTQLTAELQAHINPSGFDTTYHFEYGTSVAYGTSLPVPDGDIGSGVSDVSVSQGVSGLQAGVTYHYRVVASSSQGVQNGPDETLTTIPPAYIDGEWTTSVTSTGATINAQVNPLGSSTEYRMEYGTSTAYGQALSGNVGEGQGDVLVSYHREGLEPGTLYHYRIVAHNALGTVEGADHTFMTQAASGQELVLPDGRAWELVSPPDKKGAVIENTSLAHAASDGSGIVYSGSQPFGEGIVGHVGRSLEGTSSATVISRRGLGGWRTRDIAPEQGLPPEGETATELLTSEEGFYDFSPDLSAVVFEPLGVVKPQAEGVSERTLYLRNNTNETYQPLISAANVLPGTKYGPFGTDPMKFAAATPDLAHVVVSSPVALTEGAIEEGSQLTELEDNLYEWNDGQLRLINILPDGKSVPGVGLGNIFYLSESILGGNNTHAISNDGRWIVFRTGKTFESGAHTYYVRDMVAEKTVTFGAADGYTTFESMNDDGSKVFYLEPSSDPSGREETGREGDLHVFDAATGVDRQLTSNGHVQNELVGTSEDGSYVYLVATGVLANGAVAGEDNLYVMHESGGAWTTSFIKVLSGEDQNDWRPFEQSDGNGEVGPRASRVSSDGRYLTFMSSLPLTGYDNHDAVSGQPDDEVFLYDAVTNHLVCASCNSSGARPVGVDDSSGAGKRLLMDQNKSWNSHWVSGVTPPTWDLEHDVASYQSRFLSDSGRLFFDSSDALVPQDTNGLTDVYEYEPVGLGDCTSASVTFSEHSEGCVGLISSGQSSRESVFFDASENGDDAFFITASKLVPEDYDGGYDVYDAHVCSEQAPCSTAPVLPPECTSGDSCKAAPSPQPMLFGAPPSATFSGAGNVIEEAKSTLKHKAKPKKTKKKKTKKKRKSKNKKKGKSKEFKGAKKAGGSRGARTIRKGK